MWRNLKLLSMNKSKFKKILIAIGIIIIVLIAFIMVESNVLKSNLKNSGTDSSQVQRIK